MRIRFCQMKIFCIVSLLCGCSSYVSEQDFITDFEKKCKSEIVRGGIHFFAMALTPEYELAKWGTRLDMGERVLFWAIPRSDVSFENAILSDGKDSSAVMAYRKVESFEIGTADSYVLVFPNKFGKSFLYIKNLSAGLGNVEFKLKNCTNIHLIKK